jgi:hypothetical protein
MKKNMAICLRRTTFKISGYKVDMDFLAALNEGNKEGRLYLPFLKLNDEWYNAQKVNRVIV